MKKFILPFFILFTFSSNAFYQKINLYDSLVYNANKIIFYGFDFSGLRIADSKRMGQDLKNYLFTLTGDIVDHLPENKLCKWLVKDTVTFNLNPTTIINKKIKSEDIVSPIKNTIEKDSLQSFIDKYSITEKSGIGYVIIYECFENKTKSVYAYAVFFDISTRKILNVEYVRQRDGNSYNRMSDWNGPAIAAIKSLTRLYKDKFEASTKPK